MITNTLTNKEKVVSIRDLLSKYEISPYEIAEKASVSAMAIYNIINGETEQPREKTLDKILIAIEDVLLNSKNTLVKEPQSFYNKDDVLINKISKLEQILNENFNILAKGVSETVTNTRSIKEDTSGLCSEMQILKELLK
jgi:transcriptional regulator with XRE-family HTH domain